MRATHRDAAREALGGEVLVDHAARTGVKRHRCDVLTVEVLPLVPRPRTQAHDGVILGDQAHHLVAQQPAQVQFTRGFEPVADDQVHLAGGQAAPIVELGRQRMQFERRVWREALHAGNEFGQEQRVEVVARGDPEGRCAGDRLEAVAAHARAEQSLGFVEQLDRRLRQCQRRLRRRHAVARTHQQRVTGQRTQPLELGADDRLRALELQGRPGDAAFGDEHVQDPYEMQLNVVEARALCHKVGPIPAMRTIVYAERADGLPLRELPDRQAST